jgi:hypothetical protein
MQGKLPLISRMQGQPKPAPATILRQVETEAQAIDVSIRMAGMKAQAVADSLGCSEPYVSMLRNGKRPIPQDARRERFIDAFCHLTGTLLLRQVVRRAELEAEAEDELPASRVNARLANELRACA